MEVRFAKLSDTRHALAVTRDDGSTERVELESRSFLHHDIAHLAIESELRLEHGFWGSVASGAGLDGMGLDGFDIALAERLAGPLQALVGAGAEPAALRAALAAIAPDVVDDAVGDGIHERARRLRGHWRATPYGGEMVLVWPLGRIRDEAGSGSGA